MKRMKKQHFKIIYIIAFVAISYSFALYKINEVFGQKSHHLLSGVTIVVDPGHGGKDAGAMYGDVNEEDINLNICAKF